MRTLFIAAAFLASLAPAFASDVYVNGYYRSNGTYVQPHHRSSPDSTTTNNYNYPTPSSNPYHTDYSRTSPYGGAYGQPSGKCTSMLCN